jgi:hypothetical protein
MATCEGPHNHQCDDCHAVWHHNPRTIPDTTSAIHAAHSYPQCGKPNFFLADDESAIPQYCSNGVRCILLDGSGASIQPTTPQASSQEQELAKYRTKFEAFKEKWFAEQAASRLSQTAQARSR